ncbi:hypothetical protein A9Z42_0029320 [Trichoderma parareesei]|uniref:Uncharacterized protein n=1 Tax=Trichoderma parareesei TaxID=858221 RepID=A0A2H2Z8P5_TRIPA|nr:hypothetical protein A9Z42_0029320 [Trichoderma parareesei]
MGIAICRSFAVFKAAQDVMVGRNEALLQTTAAELAVEHPETKFTPIAADIFSEANIERLYSSLGASPAVLVKNAGYMPVPKPFIDMNLDDWWAGFQINVYGSVNVTLTYLRHRAAQPFLNSPGVVITLNTIAAYGYDLPNPSSLPFSRHLNSQVLLFIPFHWRRVVGLANV